MKDIEIEIISDVAIFVFGYIICITVSMICFWILGTIENTNTGFVILTCFTVLIIIITIIAITMFLNNYKIVKKSELN